MKFCDKCDNMYYIKLEDDECNKIIIIVKTVAIVMLIY